MSEFNPQNIPNDPSDIAERREVIRHICSTIIDEVDQRFQEAINDSAFDGPEAERIQLFSSYTYFDRECDTLRMRIPKAIRFDAPTEGVDTRSGFSRITIRKPIDLEGEIHGVLYAEVHPLVQLLSDESDTKLSPDDILRIYEDLSQLDLDDMHFDDLSPAEVKDFYAFVMEEALDSGEDTEFVADEQPILTEMTPKVSVEMLPSLEYFPTI
jgi:hypothetical protein